MSEDQSPEITELAKALALAQAEIEDAPKDTKGNFGTFASLAAVRSAITKPLCKQGLSIVQIYGADAHGDFLKTKLLHSSGQWIEGKLYLKLDKPSMQGYGSASTYARRYSQSAIVNLAQDDDDGQRSEEEGNNHPPHAATTSPLPLISEAQAKRFIAIAKNNLRTDAEITDLLSQNGYRNMNQIKRIDYDRLCKALEKHRAPPSV